MYGVGPCNILQCCQKEHTNNKLELLASDVDKDLIDASILHDGPGDAHNRLGGVGIVREYLKNKNLSQPMMSVVTVGGRSKESARMDARARIKLTSTGPGKCNRLSIRV